MGTILQSASAISNPGGTYNNPIGICAGSPTTAGSTLVTLVTSAYDIVAQTFSVADTLGNGANWQQAQYQSRSGGWNIAMHYYQNAPSYPAPIAITLTAGPGVGAGSSSLVSPWANATANYIIRFSSGETRVALLTQGSANFGWSQGLGTACTSSATAGSGPYFSQSAGNGDYTGVTIVEVGGAATSGTLISNSRINLAVPIGSNNVDCGALACGTGAGTILMFVNCVGNSGANPTYAPKKGTSPINFTQYGANYWDFGLGGLTLTQYATGTNFGTVTPTGGTQEIAADDYYVFGMFIPDAAVPAYPLLPGPSIVDQARNPLLRMQDRRRPALHCTREFEREGALLVPKRTLFLPPHTRNQQHASCHP